MAIQTAKIQATIDGQTVTIAEVALASSGALAPVTDLMNDQVIAISFDRPIKIDPGTAINLVTAQDVDSCVFSACLHTINLNF